MSAEANDELLPNRVDQIAAADPERLWAEFPLSFSSYDDGFAKLDYRQLSNAVNGAAHWIAAEFGVSVDFDTLAFSGPNDVRTPIVVLGAIKAGFKVLLTSPRNSLAAHENLFRQTQCQRYAVADPEPPHVPGLCEHLGIEPRRFPSLAALLETQHERFPYNKTFEEAKMEPMVVIHTSGSTGLPKPLVLPHLFATRYANNHQAPASPGCWSQSSFFHGVRLIHTLPMFHAAGIYHVLVSTIFSGTVYLFLKPDAPPSGEGIKEVLQHIDASAIFVAPSVVEEIGKNERLLDFFAARLNAICFAGGALSKPLGDRIAEKIRLISLYGSSELGQGIQLRDPHTDSEEDWLYQRWDEKAAGMEFRQEADGLYQLVLVKQPGRERHQPPFAIFPDTDVFYTKDLFRPHPTKKGLWAHAGRADDIIVLSNGEKINPVSMEGQISSHPKVSGALVAGEQRFHTVLLVEALGQAPQTAAERAQFIDDIWPLVQSANEVAPRHARLSKGHVVIVQPDRPMVRAGKGTVIRKATLKLYQPEIDALYESLNEAPAPDAISSAGALVHFQDRTDATNFTSKVIRDITGWKKFDQNRNLFSMGMDSLQAIMLVRQIRLQVNEPNISVATVYSNPSVNALSNHLLRHGGRPTDHVVEEDSARTERMSMKLSKYTSQIEKIAPANVAEYSVLLTGSSGFAGSYLLKRLLESPWVQRVYCLDRPPRGGKTDVRSRRERASGYEGLLRDERVHVRHGVLSKANFGLSKKEYTELRGSVDVILHAAWAVDFNQKLDAYDDQLQGMVGLTSFVSQSEKKPRLLFISSISSVQSRPGPVPEMIYDDPLSAARTGYGESKYVAERLVDSAATQLGHKNLIIRAGQIAGPASSEGGWNRHEWLPSLVASSAYLGAIPDALGPETAPDGVEAIPAAQLVDWIPVDLFARVVVEAAAHMLSPAEGDEPIDPSSHAEVIHAVNPRPTTWSSLLPSLVDTLNRYREERGQADGKAMRVVSFTEWVEQLEVSASQNWSDMEAYAQDCPAVKLLDFFQARAREGTSTPSLDTQLAESVSPSLAGVAAPLSPETVQKWVGGWLYPSR